MVSLRMIDMINESCEQATRGNIELFGGIYVYTFEDLMQLKPVKDAENLTGK